MVSVGTSINITLKKLLEHNNHQYTLVIQDVRVGSVATELNCYNGKCKVARQRANEQPELGNGNPRQDVNLRPREQQSADALPTELQTTQLSFGVQAAQILEHRSGIPDGVVCANPALDSGVH